MTITEILAAVNAAGRSLSSNGTTLTLGPGKPLPKAVLDGLREHKPGLLELLSQAEPAPTENDTFEELPLVAAAVQLFPGARVRWLSQAEYESIGFREPKEELLDSGNALHSRPTPTAASMGGAQ
jgi:hypothetical protein